MLLEGRDEESREQFWHELDIPLGPSAETVKMMEEYRRSAS